MNNVLLSIGSVCLLKGSSNKVMITGYFSPEYRNGVVVNDYVGCYYPYGSNSGMVVSFSANDIEEVLFQGYVDAKFMDLADDFSAYKSSKMVQTSNVIPAANQIVNPFVAEVPNNERVNVPNDANKWSIFNHIEFDENGVITSAVLNEDIKNDDEKMDEPTVIVHNEVSNAPSAPEAAPVQEQVPAVNAENGVYSTIVFDDNGTIVETNFPTNKKVEEAPVEPVANEENGNLPTIVFDENGTIVETNFPTRKKVEEAPVEQPAQSAPSAPKYKFDENGMVVSIEEGSEEEAPVAEAEVPAEEVPANKTPKYKFDENGQVIAIEE